MAELDLLYQGKVCPYCGQPSEYADSQEVYHGKSYGMIYICRDCDAYVGVHKGTDVALGRLADWELRQWKKRAHEAFDAIWKWKIDHGINKGIARSETYAWLSRELQIKPELTHIGFFDVEQCIKVVQLCEAYEY